MLLTRDEVLALNDIGLKEIVVPENIPAWGSKHFKIKQLTRGEQDQYLQRQFSSAKMKQTPKAKDQEIGGLSFYGHDAWLCVKGIVDDSGKPLFEEKDISILNSKSGEAIGWIAQQIVSFSGMGSDIRELDKLETDTKKS